MKSGKISLRCLNVFVFTLLFTVVADAAVSITNLSGVPSGYTYIFNGIGSSNSSHVVYCGTGNRTGGDAVLLKAVPGSSTLTVLGYVKTVSQAAGNWQALDTPGKIHSQIYEHNGLMYFGTHSASEPGNEALDSATFVNGFRGGHLYSYNPANNTMLDVNAQVGTKDVAIPHQGIMDLAIDHARGLIYTIGYPFGDIYRHTLATGADDSIWRTGMRSGGITRHLMIDNAGRVFTVNGQVLQWYNPVSGKIEMKTAANKFIAMYDRNTGSSRVQGALYSPSGDTIYFTPLGEPHIYRFIAPRDTIETIADDSTMAMAGRFDIGKIFWVCGRNLRMHDIATRVTTTIYTTMSTASMGCQGTDANGDLVFAIEGGGPFFRVNLQMPVKTEEYFYQPVAGAERAILNAMPNPFAGEVVLRLSSVAGKTKAAIYDIRGRQVVQFPAMATGMPEVRWKPAGGIQSGVYFGIIESGNQRFTAKLNYIK